VYKRQLGGLAIAGAPPFPIFISEVSIVRGGLAAGRWVSTALLVTFIIVAFCAIMYHLVGMTFGKATEPAQPLPRAAVLALVVAALPALLLGIYLPGPLGTLVHQAALALGGAS